MASHSQRGRGGPTLRGLAAPTAAHPGPQPSPECPASRLGAGRTRGLPASGSRGLSWGSGPVSNKIGCSRKIPAVPQEDAEGSATHACGWRRVWLWVPGVAVPHSLPVSAGGTTHFPVFVFGQICTQMASEVLACGEHRNPEVRAEPPLEEAALKCEV